MIPVLGVPYVNRPDLLGKMLGSIDTEIGELVVVDNSADGTLTTIGGPSKSRVFSMHHNMGVSASWNLIIKSTPDAPWWAIVNSDIVFAPGELDSLAQAMVGFDGLCKLGNMAAFALTPGAISRAGWFDENFVPAYCEDNDFVYRCQLTGVEIKNLPAQFEHEGSAVIRSDANCWNNNNRTYPMNVAYYRRKWGGGIGEPETFTTPFNMGGSPREWHLDISRLAEMTWK